MPAVRHLRIVGMQLRFVQVAQSASWVDRAQQPAHPIEQPRAITQPRCIVLGQDECRLEALDRGGQGEGALRALAGMQQPVERTRVTGLLIMVGNAIRVRARVRSKDLAGRAVPGTAAQRHQTLIQRLAHQCVREAHS